MEEDFLYPCCFVKDKCSQCFFVFGGAKYLTSDPEKPQGIFVVEAQPVCADTKRLIAC